MRELKFRAWDIKNSRFVNIVRFIFDQFGALDYAEVVFKGKIYKLYPSEIILEQYTGLKDKNGKEIYEGDIIEKCYNKAKKLYSSAPVEFKHGRFESAGWTLYKFAHKCEVIGNIHENPELLEEEE